MKQGRIFLSFSLQYYSATTFDFGDFFTVTMWSPSPKSKHSIRQSGEKRKKGGKANTSTAANVTMLQK